MEAGDVRAQNEPHRLDAWFVQKYRNQVFACATRRELDQLTRYLWQRYGSGVSATVNHTALEDFKRSILVRREQLQQHRQRRVVGVEPNKVFVPAPLMDDLFDGRKVARPVAVQAKIDVRASERPDELQRNRFLLSMLVQRIAPHLHRWNRSVVFGIERLRQDVGFEPEVRFPAAVAETFEWFERERVAEKLAFDFSFEDEILRLVKERA